MADQARTRGLRLQEAEHLVMLEPAAIKKLLEPQDVAALASDVASPAAWGMPGAVLNRDLGWTARSVLNTGCGAGIRLHIFGRRGLLVAPVILAVFYRVRRPFFGAFFAWSKQNMSIL